MLMMASVTTTVYTTSTKKFTEEVSVTVTDETTYVISLLIAPLTFLTKRKQNDGL